MQAFKWLRHEIIIVLAIFLTVNKKNVIASCCAHGSVHPPSTLCFIVLNELGGAALVMKGNTKTWFHKLRWKTFVTTIRFKSCEPTLQRIESRTGGLLHTWFYEQIYSFRSTNLFLLFQLTVFHQQYSLPKIQPTVP